MKHIETLKQVLEALEDARDNHGLHYVNEIVDLRQAIEQAEQAQPYGWKVYGVSGLFVGEYAEQDAKAEAERIGGTCIAFPLYTTPPPRQPLTSAEIMRMACKSGLDLEPPKKMSWVEVQGRHEQLLILARAIEAAHGITKENT